MDSSYCNGSSRTFTHPHTHTHTHTHTQTHTHTHTHIHTHAHKDASHVPDALGRMLHVMAEAKGWSVQHTAAITKANARRFYESGLVRDNTTTRPTDILPNPPVKVSSRAGGGGRGGDEEVPTTVTEQGDKVRKMKAKNVGVPGSFSQAELDQQIAILISLKSRLSPS